MGYKLAGYRVLGNCEIDPKMMEIYRENNHPEYSFLMDIRDFAEMPEDEVPEELKNLDVLDGSPPCSVFSLAGLREDAWGKEKKFREGQKEQRLDDLFGWYLKVAQKLRPKVIIAENVKGIIVGNSKGWVNQIVNTFREIGYTCQIFLLNSAAMGVPQKRERVFFVGHRADLDLPELVLAFNEKPVTFSAVREERGKSIDGTLAEKLMRYRRPTDRCVADINNRVRKTNAGFSNPINHDDEPVQTITANGDLYRYCDGLKMTDRDIINCQTFPQDYNFLDQNVQYVCGMSVPPVMMAKISEQVYKQWLSKPTIGADLSENYDFTGEKVVKL